MIEFKLERKALGWKGRERMIEFKLERNALVSSEQKREREAHKKVKNWIF